MNRRKEKTVITVETFQRTVVHLRRKAEIAWCELCAADVPMITPDEAAELRGTTSHTIYRLIESSDLHFTEIGRAHV